MSTKIYTVKTDNNSSITFTLKHNAVNIFEEPQNNLWTFDLEGRLVGMYINNKNYRRTLNNIFYLKSRQQINNVIFRQVNKVPKKVVYPLLNNCHNIINEHLNQLPPKFHKPLQNILSLNIIELDKDASQFNKIYLPISILPPDQYMSLVVQLTEGCNYNYCTFCNFYKNRPFKIKSITELESHLSAVKNYFGKGIKLRKSLFLADANAISVPQNRLISSLELLQNQFPKIKNVYSFVDVFTGIKKSVNDFKKLKILGLKRLYLGVESGYNDLMLFLNKIQLNKDIIELTKTIKSSGINIGIIFIVGAGGKQFADQHQKDSVDLLQKLPLSKGDIVYLSELYDTNPDYIDSMKQKNYTIPSQLQIRNWSNNLKYMIKKSISKDIQVSIYDINQFFY